jgi:hypothetical protein
MLSLPKFTISIRYGSRDYTFKVQMLVYALGVERFQVIARNKTLVLESNRPVFRRKGLKHRKPEWTLIAGEVSNSGFLELIQTAIYDWVEANGY